MSPAQSGCGSRLHLVVYRPFQSHAQNSMSFPTELTSEVVQHFFPPLNSWVRHLQRWLGGKIFIHRLKTLSPFNHVAVAQRRWWSCVDQGRSCSSNKCVWVWAHAARILHARNIRNHIRWACRSKLGGFCLYCFAGLELMCARRTMIWWEREREIYFSPA